MENIIIIKDILGTDIRSRSSVNKLNVYMTDYSSYIFDMHDIDFISRSVADELCVLAEKHSIKFINACPLVSNMIEIVQRGRNSQRIRQTNDYEIIECKDMDSLNVIFATM